MCDDVRVDEYAHTTKRGTVMKLVRDHLVKGGSSRKGVTLTAITTATQPISRAEHWELYRITQRPEMPYDKFLRELKEN